MWHSCLYYTVIHYYYSYLVVIVLSIKLWCAIPSTPHPFTIGSNWLNKFIALTIRKLLCFLSEYIHRYTIDKRQWTFFCHWNFNVNWLGLGTLKGILHPKMKILSSFTHPQVVPNLYEFLSFAEHKGRYFENDWNFGTIDFHSIFFYNGSQWCQTTVCIPFKNNGSLLPSLALKNR